MRLFPGSQEGPRVSLRRWQWGQAMVEFALVLSALLVIIFLIIEAAMVIQGYLAVEHAAREAVRWAITYQPIQGQRMSGGTCTNLNANPPFIYYPYDPLGPGDNCDPTEGTDEYNARRVAIIKEIALQRAAGLRINRNALGLTEADFQAHFNEPGFFGVRVWGFPAFDEQEQMDHPGLPGLPVRVQVVHNVIILDPLFRAIAPYIRVEAHAEMINEGVQVGYGNVPPPTFNPPPTFIISPGGTVPTESQEPGSPSPSPTPVNYQVRIAFDHATNQLPLQRGHNVTVTVTNQNGQPVPNVLVSFSTDFGAYDYSGVSPQYIKAATDQNGRAIPAIYANRPGTAHLTAWIDLDRDDYRDSGEPYDTADKEWLASGPYIVASDHTVLPLDTIAVSLYDHPPARNPYMLLWCRTSGSGGIASAVLRSGIYVNTDTWDATDLEVEIPQGSDGYYRLESHTDMGSCGNGTTLVAYSADILVETVPPDLHVLNISYPEEFGDRLPSNTEITFTIEVANLSPTALQGEYFDVDLYVDPQNPPPVAGQMGDEKQWLMDIPSYGTGIITTYLTLDPGTHALWGQVDTTGYIEEADEGNNISGPFLVEVECTARSTPYGDDFNDGVVASKWTAAQIGTPNVYGSVSESNGRLRINARGQRLWGNGSDENFYFVYQSISGDFDARLRIYEAPDVNQWSKMGLMVRNSTAANSRHVMIVYTNYHSRLQFAYRATDGGDTYRLPGTENDIPAPLPVWVRIVRSGSNFGYFYSTAQNPGLNDWIFQGSMSVAMGDAVLVGIAHATYDSTRSDISEADEFVICQPQGGTPAPSGCYPGLIDCTQLLQSGSFEGNPQAVFTYWRAGGPGAYQRQGYLQYEGAFSMRLHASLGDYPCQQNSYAPYLYQTVQIPTDVISTTHLIAEGFRAVGGSLAPCSYPNSPDADDILYVQVRDSSGQPLVTGVPIVNGGAPMEQWQYFNVDFTGNLDMSSLAGQNVQLYFYATHDQDFYGTFFYLDALECNVCKFCPIPDDEPGTASIGGLVRTLMGGVPQPLVGVEVWAYTRGGEVLYTRSIQDGTYHFYNVPPGTYYIYAQAWVGGELRTDTSTVTVVADERNYKVDLLLLGF